MEDRNLYFQMEAERAKIPNVLRNEYISVFVVKCLHEKLVPPDGGNNSRGIAGMYTDRSEFSDNPLAAGKRGKDDSMWTEDTVLEDNADFEGVFLMTMENLNYVGKTLRFAKDAVECFAVDKRKFGRFFTDEFEYPCLELLFLMDVVYKLLPINAYMMWMKEPSQVTYFKRQFLAFAFSPTAFSFENRERSNRILEHVLQCMILTHYCNPCCKPEMQNAKDLTGDVLEQITIRLIDEEHYKVNPGNHKIVLSMLRDMDIPNSVKSRYFKEHLNIILRVGRKPFRKEIEVLQFQEQFAGATKMLDLEAFSLTVTQMIQSALTTNDVVSIITAALDTADFNWEFLLCLVTVWIQEKQNQATAILKDLIKAKIRDGLLKKDETGVMSGFILARHCSLVASTLFSRYEKWFTNAFESEKYSPANEKETFIFLTNVLMKWVSVEPTCFLHVHATFWPFIPKGCRENWAEYTTVSKIRISECKEVEEAMEYEPNPNDPLQYEVEMAIKTFETYGKIPQSILKLWVFRKQYYLNDFLPTLLRKPVGVPLTDSRLRLIELLKREDKIPEQMYSKYKAAIRGF